jgi:Flp pilus assembly protein TadD
MKLIDSCLCLALGALLFAAPADAATTKKPIKPVAKVAAPVIEPQPDPVTLIAQAHEAQSRGDTELAVRLAQSAIVADPARPSAYDALGDVYAANNQPDAARSYYGEALSIDPGDAAAQKAMSALGRGPGQQAKAADEGQKTGTP